MTDRSNIPYRDVPYLPLKTIVTPRDDGTILVENGLPLKDAPPHMLWPLVHWATAEPSRVWLAERDPDDPSAEGWVELTYADGLARVKALTEGLLALGAGQDAPVMILSNNSIDHAVIMYAAIWAGSPVVPVTPAYALLSQDFQRLKYIDSLISPAIIYVQDGANYQRGLDAMGLNGRKVIYRRNAPTNCDAMSLDELARTPGAAVDTAYEHLSPDMVTKYMMTSGSTGEPKAVMHTHRMLASNAKMIRSIWDEERMEALSGGPQVMCNFLPWSHTFGANAILHNMLDWGGTLYIDQGAPTPARLPEMLRNLKSVATTQHTTVPAAWVALATELERDDELAEVFFSRIFSMAYGGAAMGQDIYERIQDVAVRVTGHRITLSAGYGATETAPTASNVHWPNDRMGLIGLPLPGNTFKLVPTGEKMEARVKGVNVTPGYYRNPEKTAASFDEEGFYCLGDAVRFVDPDAPEEGLAFDGRTAEEFKLLSGTWVSAGTVRMNVVSEVGGVLSDAVICGLNEKDIRILGFINEEFCRRLVGEHLELSELLLHPEVRSSVIKGVRKHNHKHSKSSSRISCVLLQSKQPRAELGEVTEKGYLNQNKVQSLRLNEVEILYSPSDCSRMVNVD